MVRRKRRGTYISDFMPVDQYKRVKKYMVGYVAVAKGGFLKVKIDKKNYYIGLRKLTRVLRGEQPYTVIFNSGVFTVKSRRKE